MEFKTEEHNGNTFNIIYAKRPQEFLEWTQARQRELLAGQAKVRRNSLMHTDLWQSRQNFTNPWYGDHGATSAHEFLNLQTFKQKPLYQEQRVLLTKKVEKLFQTLEVPQKKTKYTDNVGVFVFDRAAMSLRRKRLEDGSIKIVSDFPKVFAIKELKNTDRQSIRIFLPLGYPAAVAASEALYNAMPSVFLAEYMVGLGYDVEVVAVFTAGKSERSGYGFYGTALTFKAFDQELSIDRFLAEACSVGVFRGRTILYMPTVYDHFGAETPGGVGEPITSHIFSHRSFLREKYKDSVVVLPDPAFSADQVERSLIQAVKSFKEELKNPAGAAG